MVVILWVREQHVKLQLHRVYRRFWQCTSFQHLQISEQKNIEIIYKIKDVSGLIHLIFQHGSKPMGETSRSKNNEKNNNMLLKVKLHYKPVCS